MNESILTSVKKLLGIMEDCEEFDQDIIMHINSSFFTLSQLGVGSAGFRITDKETTYQDYLNDNQDLINAVSVYIPYKVKLGWDPPSSSVAVELIKEELKEMEYRLLLQVEEVNEKGGEISK